ncbi:MAG: restriction endonuclease [Desulfurococcaceae archaeon]
MKCELVVEAPGAEWVEEFLKTDDEALGVYVAIQWLLVAYKNKIVEGDGLKVVSPLRSVYARIAERGFDYEKAFNAGVNFVNKLLELHKDARDRPDYRERLLSIIEASYYKRFVDAYAKLVDPTKIDPGRRNLVVEVLKDLKLGNIDLVYFAGYIKHPNGTVEFEEVLFEGFIESHYQLGDSNVFNVLAEMENSRLVLFKWHNSFVYLVFPSVVFASEIMDLIKSGRAPEARAPAEAAPAKPASPARFRVRPSRDILESIVAEALASLGFNTRIDVRLPSRSGGFIEVDVWGEKKIGDVKFTVYVSCKNWDKDVDRSVVDEEFGRVLNLREVPHLRVLVARRLTDPAREAALADGFLVVELGEKASAETAEGIYELVYKRFRDLFTGIAPPELQRLALEVKAIAENLKSIAEKLERAGY